jgi:cAMP-specific phosphodiesterase 4
VAAMMHDFRHKGVSNTFLVNSEDELAIVHNDVSVLERFHAAETFRLLKQDECNILHGMEEEVSGMNF